MINILLAMCNEENLEVTAYFLKRAGFGVKTLLSFGDVLEEWEKNEPDILVLDSRFGNNSGFDICRSFRTVYDNPIVLLHERWREETVVAGYSVRADSYLIQPFSFRELKENLSTLYWRFTKREGRLNSSRIKVGPLEMDKDDYSCTVSGSKLYLTRIEFLLTYVLACNFNQVITPERLIEFAWHPLNDADGSLIKTHFSHVRRKLREIGCNSIRIRSVVGVGYIMDVDEVD